MPKNDEFTRRKQLCALYSVGASDRLARRKRPVTSHRIMSDLQGPKREKTRPNTTSRLQKSLRETLEYGKLRPWYYGYSNSPDVSSSSPAAAISRYTATGTLKLMQRDAASVGKTLNRGGGLDVTKMVNEWAPMLRCRPATSQGSFTTPKAWPENAAHPHGSYSKLMQPMPWFDNETTCNTLCQYTYDEEVAGAASQGRAQASNFGETVKSSLANSRKASRDGRLLGESGFISEAAGEAWHGMVADPEGQGQGDGHVTFNGEGSGILGAPAIALPEGLQRNISRDRNTYEYLVYSASIESLQRAELASHHVTMRRKKGSSRTLRASRRERSLGRGKTKGKRRGSGLLDGKDLAEPQIRKLKGDFIVLANENKGMCKVLTSRNLQGRIKAQDVESWSKWNTIRHVFKTLVGSSSALVSAAQQRQVQEQALKGLAAKFQAQAQPPRRGHNAPSTLASTFVTCQQFVDAIKGNQMSIGEQDLHKLFVVIRAESKGFASINGSGTCGLKATGGGSYTVIGMGGDDGGSNDTVEGLVDWTYLVASMRLLCKDETTEEKLLGAFNVYSEYAANPPTLGSTWKLFTMSCGNEQQAHAVITIWRHRFRLELESVMLNGKRMLGSVSRMTDKAVTPQQFERALTKCPALVALVQTQLQRHMAQLGKTRNGKAVV
ncbi:unnamed protein product [Chrysoparadoxa australica]